jgi:hypothetical protein
MVMDFTLRPYVSAGVVVAGAGLIAAAQVGQPAPHTQTRAVQLTTFEDIAAPDLTTDQAYPIATWSDAYSDTVSNLETLQQEFAGDPNPIGSAIDANLADYANELETAAQTSSNNLANVLQDFEGVLSTAWSDLQTGDLYDAETSVWQFLLDEPVSVIRPFESAIFDIDSSIAGNIENLLSSDSYLNYAVPDYYMQVFAVPEWVVDLEAAGLYGPNAAEYAIAGVTQDIIDAWQSGDYSLAEQDLANAGSTIVDAFLNGYQVDGAIGNPLPDLVADSIAPKLGLDPDEGLINGGLEHVKLAEDTIADDLGGGEKAFDVTAASASSVDVNPDTVSVFDPNAVTDISSLLSADLAPNAGGSLADLLSLF